MSLHKQATQIVLASASPRRRELLTQLGLQFTLASPDIDETPLRGELPVPYVRRLAVEKAHAIAAPAGSLVIAADTTVDLGGDILGKPEGDDEARSMLRRLSGRTHRVHTGLALQWDDRTVAETVTSLVTFSVLSDEMIEWYVGLGEPMGKAGAYAVQGAGGVLVERVRGSVSNIIGLPLHTLLRLATDLDVQLLT
jgi:septum formation protein